MEILVLCLLSEQLNVAAIVTKGHQSLMIQFVKIQGLEKDFGSSQAFKAGYQTWGVGILILERREMHLTANFFAMDAGDKD